MPELTHDTTEDGFHEIQLSGKQLVFLFMVTTVVSVVIFLCGVLVGRGVGSGAEQPIESATSDAASTGAAETAQPAPTVVEPPPVVGESELTADERLRQADAPKEQLKKPEPPPQASPQPNAARPTAPPAPAAAAASPAVDGVPTSGRPGAWVIQVQALRNRAAAGAIVQRLIAKGYPAFLLQSAPGVPPLYRVQIGRYRDRSEAEQVARRLQKEEQFTPDIKR